MADVNLSIPDELLGVSESTEPEVMPEQDMQPEPESLPEFVTIPVGHGEVKIQSGASDEAVQNAISHYIQTPEFYKGIDRQSGADWNATKSVGDAFKREDKLATLQQFYPDAREYGDDNYIFTNPETGRVTLFNSPGFDAKDVMRYARDITVGVGATLGGIAGAPAGPGGSAAGAVAMASATGSAYDFISQQFGYTQRSETMLERTAGGVIEAMGAGAGGLVGDVAVPAVVLGAKRMLGGGTAKAQQIFDTMVAHGIKPTAGAVTSGKGAGRIESSLDAAAASATTMRNQIEEVVKTAEKAVGEVSKKVGVARSQQGTGARMQSAARTAVEKFVVQQSKLEDDLAAKIGDDAMFSVDAVRQLGGELKTLRDQMPNFSEKAYGEIMGVVEGFLDDAARNGGRIPYQAFREVRSFFGAKMSDMGEGVNRAVYKRLYAAMTDDLQTGAKIRGLGNMFEDTVAFTRNFKSEYDDFLNKLIDYDAPEKGYRFLMNSRRDGGTFFQKMKDQFNDDEWADVSATIIQKMGFKNFGNEADEAFSVNTFLTNWDSIADEAKVALFSGIKGGKETQKNLTELVSVFRSMQESARLGNFSNTAGATHTLNLMSALGGDATKLILGGLVVGGQPELAGLGLAGTIGGYIIAPASAAKLITNPKFVKWLAQGPAARTGAEVGAHIGRLTAIFNDSPEIQPELNEFISALEGGNVRNQEEMQ